MDKIVKFDFFMQKIGMRGKFKVIDFIRNEVMVEMLIEIKIYCEIDEKDFYLYYFLMQYLGCSLVFVNSIFCIKCFFGFFKVFDIMFLILYVCMYQKQRFRNLEQFVCLEDCVFLVIDVVVWGLDIFKVQYVIYYQVLCILEIYVY